MIIRTNNEWHTLSYIDKINYYYSVPSRIRPYFDLFKVTLPAVGNLRATVYEAIQDNKETIGHFCGRTGIDFQELNRFLHYGKMDDSLYQQIIGGLNLPDTNDYRRYVSVNFTKQEVNSTYKVSKQYVLLVVLTILLKGFMLYVVVNPPFDTAGSTYLFMLSLIGLTFFIDVNIGSLPMYRKDDKNEKL